MAALRLLNLLALAAIAIVALSSGPVRVNALVADHAQVARNVHAHDAIAKRKRTDSSSTSGQCKPRPSSSAPPTSTPPPPTSTPPPPTSTTPPPPSSTTSSAPSTTTTPSSNSGKRMCLAWGADPAFLPNFERSNVGYIYNWGPNPPVVPGLQSMMMLWGGDADRVAAFQSAIAADTGSINIILGMNEPNEPSQSNLTPEAAFALWQTNIAPLAQKGYQLISPACTNDDSGLEWYSGFFNLTNAAGLEVHGIAVHAYVTDAPSVIAYVKKLYALYGLPVWITEFADQNFSGVGGQASMDDIWNYAGEMMDFINANDWVVACPFGIMTDLQGVNPLNSLLSSNGYPTDLGYYYLG